ncbi:hypothetical protein QJS04_geneDACA014500 [Acorus gramineus]|uniref:Uncharacterized protein n=1 Tax=Acorus gramineus TaxID=55184 RepID=A0AAV9ASU6_ACOGR|nr:hypothetical protein QJS04_geneDACA014500 [Acorus gramineus]
MTLFLQSPEGIVEEIARVHRSLPSRPGIDEIEAALSLVHDMDQEEHSRLESLSKQNKGFDVPEELFFVLQQMQKSLLVYQNKEQRREPLKLLDLENVHKLFDELVLRASKCLPNLTNSVTASASAASASLSVPDSSDIVSTTISLVTSSVSGEGNQKLSLIKLASLIEVSAKKGSKVLDLQNKLIEKIEWLPHSIGKLSNLITLDLSENRIAALPTTIGGLSSLTKLALHSNSLSELPEAIGDLFSLTHLDLRANQLTSLPFSIGKLSHLSEFDLSLNRMTVVSDAFGSLISLKKLNLDMNDIEELPHTIGQCASLVELRIDYNRLKALPEAIGRLHKLEVLSLRYNNVKSLPTTMASLSSLKELDLSFNELEGLPESLCLVTTLLKLNVGNNFSDLQCLPKSIGNLEALQELDMSNNQIRFLPDSFGMLTQLHVLKVLENPLEVPPRGVAEMGAQAVVQYMIEYVAKRNVKAQTLKNRNTWAQFCCFSRSDYGRHDGLDCAKA